MKAQIARGADFESGNLITRAKNLVPLLVPLFISAFRRANDLAMAMEARCYRGGEGRTKMKPLQYKKRDWKVVVRFAVNVSVCYLIAYGIAKPLIRALMSGFEVTAQENVAMICGMGLFVALNYLGQRFFAFKTEE